MARPLRALSEVWSREPRGNTRRLAISFVTLVAFVVQILLVQTHIHGTARFGVTSVPATIAKIDGKERSDKFPPANDPANCPICQEMLHAGAFVAPGAATLQITTLASVIDFVFVEIFATAQTRSHGWKSRAPPIP